MVLHKVSIILWVWVKWLAKNLNFVIVRNRPGYPLFDVNFSLKFANFLGFDSLDVESLNPSNFQILLGHVILIASINVATVISTARSSSVIKIFFKALTDQNLDTLNFKVWKLFRNVSIFWSFHSKIFSCDDFLSKVEVRLFLEKQIIKPK